jgi:hypothetical protein
MTLKAAGRDKPIEIWGPIPEARTVDPLPSIRPVADWKLVQFIAMPVQIALSTHGGPDDDIDAFAPRLQLPRKASHRGLIIAGILDFHLVIEARVTNNRSGVCDLQHI